MNGDVFIKTSSLTHVNDAVFRFMSLSVVVCILGKGGGVRNVHRNV